MTKRYLVSGILVLTLAACANPLDVSNLNDPDRTRTFSNAQDLQVFIAGLYAVYHGPRGLTSIARAALRKRSSQPARPATPSECRT